MNDIIPGCIVGYLSICCVSKPECINRRWVACSFFLMNSLTTIWWSDFPTYYLLIAYGEWRMTLFCGISLNQIK